MDSYEESNNDNKLGFFKYVFNFDETNKGILMNTFLIELLNIMYLINFRSLTKILNY